MLSKSLCVENFPALYFVSCLKNSEAITNMDNCHWSCFTDQKSQERRINVTKNTGQSTSKVHKHGNNILHSEKSSEVQTKNHKSVELQA